MTTRGPVSFELLESTFPLDSSTQDRFLEGLDDISLTLRYTTDIDEYEAARRPWLPATR
jgi:3-isopropylmalate/(R)-2-methylmalate dehydratase small subunit